MDIKSFFQDFNPGKFLAYLSLVIFIYLLALRLDEEIFWNYWYVFMPLWIYNIIVVIGALIGSAVWWSNPRYRLDIESYIQYKAMILTFALHLLILMFEMLLCDKLQNGNYFWTLVFIPLLFASVISIPICVWSFHRHKSFDLPLCCGINCVQFIFFALKLDNFIQWSWMMIFIPSWMIECLSILGIISIIILTFTLIKSFHLLHIVRKNILSAGIYFFILIPILIFQILLISKLNDESKMKYTLIVFPLIISILLMLTLSFASKPQNPWWFGLRKDLCTLFLELFPSLREYFNVSYDCRHPLSENDEERQMTSSLDLINSHATNDNLNSSVVINQSINSTSYNDSYLNINNTRNNEYNHYNYQLLTGHANSESTPQNQRNKSSPATLKSLIFHPYSGIHNFNNSADDHNYKTENGNKQQCYHKTINYCDNQDNPGGSSNAHFNINLHANAENRRLSRTKEEFSGRDKTSKLFPSYVSIFLPD
ncbi:unnamed protein product [Gordionus sp. m RMFG-2023]